MSGDNQKPRRLVIRMPNWLGDADMAMPAVVAVRAALPDVSLAVAAIPSIAPLFEENTGLRQQELIVVDKSNELSRLREGKFDVILLLPNSFHSAWIAKRAGIPHRWGYRAAA